MAKIVLPTTTPYSPDVQSPRLSTAPTSEETFANLVGQVSDKLMNFALKERERQDQLTLAENPLKESIIESYKENFDSTVFNEDGSINYEQSLLRSENILESRDVLYDKAKADVVRKYQELGLSRRVFEGVQSSVIGAFKENDESIRQSILQQQDALKVGYVDKLKLDFTEDPSADIETSLGKMLGVIESMTVEEEKSKQRAEFIQFARSSIVEKASTFDGALQIIGGFESDALNKAVKDTRAVTLSFSTIKTELTNGVTKEDVSEEDWDFVPIDDASFEAFKQFSLSLPSNHPNKDKTEAVTSLYESKLSLQDSLEEVNLLIVEGKTEEAARRGKLIGLKQQGVYFDRLMVGMDATDENQVRAFSNIVNYFSMVNSNLPKPIQDRVQTFVNQPTFQTQTEQLLFESLHRKVLEGTINLDNKTKNRLLAFNRFDSDGEVLLNPPKSKTSGTSSTSTPATKTTTGLSAEITDDQIDRVLAGMGRSDQGDEWLSWLHLAINGNEDKYVDLRAKVKAKIESKTLDYMNADYVELEAYQRAVDDFWSNNSFVEINGNRVLLENYSFNNLRDSSGNPVPMEEFSTRLEMAIRDKIATLPGLTEDQIEDQLDALDDAGFKLMGGNTSGMIFFQTEDRILGFAINADEIARDFATGVTHVDTNDLLNLFEEAPETLSSNSLGALQTIMPSSSRQIQQANRYLSAHQRSGGRAIAEDDLQYYLDNYPFKQEDPGYLEFVQGFGDIKPEVTIEALKARTRSIIGASTGDKFITHPYTRSIMEENFNALLEGFQHSDPIDAIERAIQRSSEEGRPLGFFEEQFALSSDSFEAVFDPILQTFNITYKPEERTRIHKEISEWIGKGKPLSDLSNQAQTAFKDLSEKALELTEETYQLQVNSLKTNEARRIFFNERIRTPIDLYNYRFSGVTDPTEAIRTLKDDTPIRAKEKPSSVWGLFTSTAEGLMDDGSSEPTAWSTGKKDAESLNESIRSFQSAFNLKRRVKLENPNTETPDDLNTYLAAERFARNPKIWPELVVPFAKSIDLDPEIKGGSNILKYIMQENPGLSEDEVFLLIRFSMADQMDKAGSGDMGLPPDKIPFALDRKSILKMFDAINLVSNEDKQ